MQTLGRFIESKLGASQKDPFYEDCKGAAITDVGSKAVTASRETLHLNTDMKRRR
jgi:hypothetical protein